MADFPLRHVFVMDPIEAIDIEADTTFALMIEAQNRGHRLYVSDPLSLGIEAGEVTAVVQEVCLRRKSGRHADLASPTDVQLDSVADVVWQRKDPPVDSEYTTATQILTICRRALVLNRPAGILAANEKLYTVHFHELMPETLVSSDSAKILAFFDQLDGEMIVKPLNGCGGAGVFLLRRGDHNLNSILEQSTQSGATRTMAQRYLPEVRDGDKRILLLDGVPLGAVLRVPARNEVRANLHVGGRAVRATLSPEDLRIVERLRPWLQQDGLFLVGIDVIGGKLTEVNVTSPTGLQEMSRLDDIRYEIRVIDEVVRLAEARSPQT